MRGFDLSSTRISVVVCTYNRARLLVGVLQSLCEQTLAASQYEVIVVDNKSEDNTHAVTEKFCSLYPNVRYCFETKQGLSHARNLGWKESKGDYVAYIDDDCKVPEHFLAVAEDIIEQVFPVVFGGPSYAFYDTPKPCWYKDFYGSHEPYKESRTLNEKECVNIYGMNMFFRRSVLQAMGGFDPRFGMSGKKIAYGEETVLLKLIYDAMPDQVIYYEPKLYVYHLVPAKKMAMRWLVGSYFAHGRYSIYCSDSVFGRVPSESGGRLQLLQRALRTTRALVEDLAISLLQRDQKRYPYVQNYLMERVFRHLHRLGMLYEQYLQIKQKP